MIDKIKNYQLCGETFILCEEEPSCFLSESLIEGSVRLRSCFQPMDPQNIDYEEGRDYIVVTLKDCFSGLRNPEFPIIQNIITGNNSLKNVSI